jgi:hypothetical protein
MRAAESLRQTVGSKDSAPLGAVLADLEHFAEADVVCRQAFLLVRHRGSFRIVI